MFRAGWIARAICILRQDLTLLALVTAFVAVSAGALTAAIHDPTEAPDSQETAVLDHEPVPAAPAEELLARAEQPAHVAEVGAASELVIIQGELQRGDGDSIAVRQRRLLDPPPALVVAQHAGRLARARHYRRRPSTCHYTGTQPD